MQTPQERALFLEAEVMLQLTQLCTSTDSKTLREFAEKIEAEICLFQHLTKKANHIAKRFAIAFFDACRSAGPLRIGCATIQLLNIWRFPFCYFVSKMRSNLPEEDPDRCAPHSDDDDEEDETPFATMYAWVRLPVKMPRNIPEGYSFSDLLTCMDLCERTARKANPPTIPDYTLVGNRKALQASIEAREAEAEPPSAKRGRLSTSD